MLDFTIEADFRPMPMGFEEGAAKAIALLRRLSDIDLFSSGWQTAGISLETDEAAFIKAVEREQAGEGAENGFHFVISENASGLPPESFLVEISFDRHQGALNAKISMRSELVTLKTVFDVITCFNDWAELQHVSGTPMFYVPEDSPIDPVNRRGIGWAGWVPFHLTNDQLAEAGVLSELGQGTFVASQNVFWTVTDRPAVKRAQAMELRLNSLGMLPTRRILSQGTWGKTSP